MSGKPGTASHSPSRTDTMIGAGMRVEGDIAFAGVLRVQGSVLGDITCDADAHGTLVADASGKLTGEITAPYVVVKGRVDGSINSSQSLQIHPGASVVGDVSYREIEIHRDGIIEGMLTPTVSLERERSEAERQVEHALPHGNEGRFLERFGGTLKLAAAAMLISVAFAVAWRNYNPIVIAPAADSTALRADASIRNVAEAKPALAAGAWSAADQATAGHADATPPLPAANSDAPGMAQNILPEHPMPDAEKVVAVLGANPGKPADFFWLISKEPSVLLKKQRHDPGDGMRIEVSPGKKMSIAIAENEIFRVAEGRGVEILFQGRKVGPKTLETGAWISFVPQSSRNER